MVTLGITICILHRQRFTHIWTLLLGSLRVFNKFPSISASLIYVITELHFMFTF